ncbi:MAG: PDGLE domain-containing protein, partial [Actinobacteria bacterium]|nr:PDGLE domain-containing protein [Actinomycetota bacterium]
GLERVAQDTGFAANAEEHTLAASPFADYATQGIGDETLSFAIAGVVGVVVTLAVGSGVILAVRGDRRRPARTRATV